MLVEFETVLRTHNRFVIPSETRKMLGIRPSDIIAITINGKKFSKPLPLDKGRIQIPVDIARTIDLRYGDRIKCQITAAMQLVDYLEYMSNQGSWWANGD